MSILPTMCGLVGWVDIRPESEAVLRKMTQVLEHRGPDGMGIYCQKTVGLGHRRLGILDLDKSQQPMISPCGRYVLAYNGEIYNFKELRKELKNLGVIFQTKGDTEVLLQALITWGEEAVSKLSGMFAFAFWDAKEEALLLARDPLGIKPLYIYRDSDRILFASEMQAILAHPACPKEINPNAIGLYLECQFIPAPETIFQKIRKILPAHILLYEGRCLEQRCYWTPSYSPKWEGSEEDALELLEKHLRRSVRSMLVADVPIGAFVSGGIDSSLIAAIMQEESGKKAEIFSIGLNHTHTEKEHAEHVANFLGANFHPLIVQPHDLMKAMDHTFDEPCGDQAMLPTLLLSQLAAKQIKVVLTGEGADEILAGYSNYPKRLKEMQITSRLHASPLPYLYPLMPEKLRKSRICKAMARPLSRRYTTIPNLFDREIYGSLLNKSFLSAQTSSMEQFGESYFFESDAEEYLDKMLHIDTRLWLADDLLTKVDRATMAHSIEARVPYLDHQLVEFVARLPTHLKLRNFEGKFLLKKWAAKGLIPKDIAYRPKWGFVMPLGDWMGNELKPVVNEMLSEGGLLGRNIFKPQFIDLLKNRGRKSDGTRLYSLLMLEIWFRKHMPNYKFN